ncbi:MAG: hypothetical protein ACRC0Y_12925 [Fusobacteriaceae bacterium]
MIEISYDSSKVVDYKFIKTRTDEIIQNVENILSRIKGNVPLNREKGMDSSLVDETLEYVKVHMTAVLMDELERDEPRFEVSEVDYVKEENTGKITIKVRGVILNE